MSRSVVVVGGGIAGLEAALTLARTVDDAHVQLISDKPDLHVLPNLVYVPFGIRPDIVSVPLEQILSDDPVELIQGRCERVDLEAQTVTVDGRDLAYDEVIVAPGVIPDNSPYHHLRSTEAALALQDALGERTARARTTIVIRVLPSSSWPGPAYEFSFLLARWLQACGLGRATELLLVTSEHEPFDVFGYAASQLMSSRLADAGVTMVGGVPPGRVEAVEGDLIIDFAGSHANKIPGVTHLSPERYFATDEYGRIEDHAFVVGDAASLPYKAGFATGWQARRVAEAIGGDLSKLGAEVDGVPIGSCEYQMDLGDATLHVRFDAKSHFTGYHSGSRANTWVSADHPDKLRGTLLRTQIPTHHFTDHPSQV